MFLACNGKGRGDPIVPLLLPHSVIKHYTKLENMYNTTKTLSFFCKFLHVCIMQVRQSHAQSGVFTNILSKKIINVEKIIEISTFNLKCIRSIFPLLLIAYILICDYFWNERSKDTLIIYTLLSYYACLCHNSYIDIMI